MRRVHQGVATLALIALIVACSARQTVPEGPAPEYERPTLPPWDAAAVHDPLDDDTDSGDWVEDEPTADSPAAPDAGVTSSDAGVPDAAASAP